LLHIETADRMPDGHALWLEWNRFTAPLMGKRGPLAAREGDMLKADTEKLFGFTRIVGRKD
ncbi:MAG TPA: hypothetical protein VHL34_19690, partial [Rhizomicrobium sp.]|nr:hypothetical protein [Rhizomicrobium sp.]